MTTKIRVLIIGGYGAVGREAATALAGDFTVQVAGRHPEKARPVPGTTAVRLDLADPAQVEAALDGVDVVLMCAETGNADLARAALGRGIHYLDISATPSVLAAIEPLGPLAARHGATAILSVGLAPGVTTLLAGYAAARAPGTPVDIGVLLGSGERHGAAAIDWTLEGLGQIAGSWPAVFPAPYGRRTVHAFPFAGPAGTRHGLALDSRPMTALLGALNRPAVALLLRRPAARRFAAGLLDAVHLGGDGFAVSVRAGSVTAGFTGNRQSRATGLFAAQAIRMLDTMPAGVAHIDQLVDPATFLTALAAQGFHLELD
ncbi:NAD(P)H-binding protein [Actinoplanes sp. NBRC 101535]|uniref:saccharopine dehydrogenase NADP-binding domain-containing protein n=1 Tax=Actinoplanes sp. NBRC 101535 TaxID=3032196 RepID=UPI0024A075BB|nr:NAD(P)H-binding protein [Actinoplanes sp. NBRC 101535]GLY02546.1 hypothetical protein Acsp01_29250 [Actinoplanes sp. NBRC 101535]